jgi:type IV pilus biogenesis protein PilP
MRLRDLALVLLVLPSCSALAAKKPTSFEPVCSASLGPAEQIACLQTQNAVLKAQIEHRDLAQKLDNQNGKPIQRQITSLPSVLSTFAVDGGKAQAVLTWSGPDGGTLTVHQGQDLPQGWHVDTIDQGRVVIQRGRERHVLFLAGGVPATTDAPQSDAGGSRSGSMGPGATQIVPPFPAYGQQIMRPATP